MRIMKKSKMPPILALMLILSAFLFVGQTAAYAADDQKMAQILSVDEVWLTGDTLHITVTDGKSGVSQTMELFLSEYADPDDEYVTIQVTDSSGNISNEIQFRNPYYVPKEDITVVIPTDENPPVPNDDTDGLFDAVPTDEDPPTPNDDTDGLFDAVTPDENPSTPNDEADEPTTQDGSNPFTPDGTGTVLDNAVDGDGKEFFTVKTPDDNVFYLIIDRQRQTDNVYLLNPVTERDLMSLATDSNDTETINPPISTVEPEPEQQINVEPVTPQPPSESSGGNSSVIFIIIAVLAVGGAGYYFKIKRPRKHADFDEDDDGYENEQEEYNNDTELYVENDNEEDYK